MRTLLLAVLLLLSAPPALAEPLDRLVALEERFDAAMAVRTEDPFASDARLAAYASDLEALMDDDPAAITAGVMYNLANARLLIGETGRAIVWYRRALRLDPSFADASHNLSVARERVATKVTDQSTAGAIAQGLAWHAWIGVGVRAGVAVALLALGWLVLIVKVCRPLAGIAWLALPCFVLGALPLASLVVQAAAEANNEAAVVVADELIARDGPADTYSQTFSQPLTSGVEGWIQEERGSWVRLRLAGDRVTWVSRRGVERVNPDA